MTAMQNRVGPHRNHGARLRDFVWQGRRCVSLENEVLRTVIALDKGCDILELTHKPSDTEMLHQAPAGMFPPLGMPSSPLPGGGFRDQFPGGWYVMLPNGPGPCEHGGIAVGHHGEATFLPWDHAIEEDRAERVVLRCHVRLRRMPLLIERRIILEAAGAVLRIEEAVTNESAQPLDILWGHHPTFGAPLLGASARIDIPAADIATGEAPPPAATLPPGEAGRWPVLGGQDLSVFPDTGGNSQDFVRITGFDAGWFAIRNPARRAGVAVRWDETLFPLLGYWRLAGGGGDYPWYGSRTMLALEPCNDLPSLAEAAAKGTAIRLAPGETRATELVAALFAADGRAVTGMGWNGELELEKTDAA
jgi:galactose mutarotase-like enzyme